MYKFKVITLPVEESAPANSLQVTGALKLVIQKSYIWNRSDTVLKQTKT
jgi:hypothetical protein